jgi:hypothetical protein
VDLSLLIAKVTSVVYLAAALGGFVSRDHYRRVLDDAFSNAALTYFMGFTAVIVGCLLVNYHNIWARDWTVLVTILGWLTSWPAGVKRPSGAAGLRGGSRGAPKRQPTTSRPMSWRATMSFITSAVPSPISSPMTSRIRCSNGSSSV